MRQDLRPAPLSGQVLKRYVLAALERLPAGSADVRVRVVGARMIARWNRDFLGRDRPTNVISFPDSDLPATPGSAVSGDIVVSAPTCMEQTKRWTEPAEARVFFFVLHGILHLAGYDHEAGGGQARRMRRREMALYRSVLAQQSRDDGIT